MSEKPSVHRAAAEGFSSGAEAYVRGRPDYPPQALDWLRDTLGLGPGKTVVDLGAGTGKFTKVLLATGADVIAVDPVMPMLDRLRRDLQAAPGDKAGRILLYVHGYNNRVDEALSQADQIAMAARFDGPVVAFIWPSQHALAKYTWDAENAAWTQAYFDTVLADLAGQSSELVLVAHSMGNRIAIDGLRHLQSISQKPGAPDLAARVKTLVLAAPDIDRELFDRDMAPDIVRQGRRIALFASGRDLALRSSWALHGNPRAGDVGCSFRLRRRTGPLVAAPRCYPDPRGAPGEMIVIDGSDLPGKPLGHSTHIDTPEGRAILRRLLTPGAAPLPAEKGVLTLKIDSPPDCASGPSRLGLEYVVARCEVKKK
jgi:SAM-dependent methyltransferase